MPWMLRSAHQKALPGVPDVGASRGPFFVGFVSQFSTVFMTVELTFQPDPGEMTLHARVGLIPEFRAAPGLPDGLGLLL
jgi:hypothetical protein